MRLVLLLIAAALIAAPGAALASNTSSASSAQIAAKKKPKPAKKSKKPKKTKKAKQAKRSSTSAGLVPSASRREAKGPIVALAPLTVGTLACDVPATLSVTGFAVGDIVEIKCDLVNGAWTLRKIEREDDAPAAIPGTQASEEVEVKGTIVTLAPLQVGSTVCAVPAGMSLTGFAVGQFVELECTLVGGVLTVKKLKREDDDDDNGEDRSGSNAGPGSSGSSGDDDSDSSGSGRGGDSGSGGDDD